MTVPPVDWPRVRAVFEQRCDTVGVRRVRLTSRRPAGETCACGIKSSAMLSSHDNAGQFLETPLDVPLADFAVCPQTWKVHGNRSLPA
jgi:hypothetical protein